MKVLKFGGTSVGSATSLINVKNIVESEQQPVIVVVSALGGVTNQLIEMTQLAMRHDSAYEAILAKVRQRHLDIIAQVVPHDRQHQARQVVEQFIDGNLTSHYSILCLNNGLNHTEQRHLADTIVCHGEILSSAIVASMIDDAAPYYSPSFIKTTPDAEGKPILDEALTEQLIRQVLAHCVHRRIVLQGFIAQDAHTGQATTLGRGGSDFTAALVAAALNAEALEIWTDVDGFYDSDPRHNPQARLLQHMTYAEAQRLCDAGAKVIYPPTIAPVAARGIPVWVKNTFNPTAPGTLIKG